MDNEDLAFVKWLLIAKGGKRGRVIADKIEIEAQKPEPVPPKTYLRPVERARMSTKPRRTKPDYKPVEDAR